MKITLFLDVLCKAFKSMDMSYVQYTQYNLYN